MKKLIIAVFSCIIAINVMAKTDAKAKAAPKTAPKPKTAGFQLSLVPEIAIQDRDTVINGVSIGVWNENPSSKFNWQFGFVNGTSGTSTGVQWFVLLPTFYNYAENFTGAQIGWVNYTSDDFVGLQWGVVNITGGDFVGAQLGPVNIVKGSATGFQGGIVNYADSGENLFQLGLVNIIKDNEWFSDFPSDLSRGMVIVNWSFGSD